MLVQMLLRCLNVMAVAGSICGSGRQPDMARFLPGGGVISPDDPVAGQINGLIWSKQSILGFFPIGKGGF